MTGQDQTDGRTLADDEAISDGSASVAPTPNVATMAGTKAGTVAPAADPERTGREHSDLNGATVSAPAVASGASEPGEDASTGATDPVGPSGDIPRPFQLSLATTERADTETSSALPTSPERPPDATLQQTDAEQPTHPANGSALDASVTADAGNQGVAVRVSLGSVGSVEVHMTHRTSDGTPDVTITADRLDTLRDVVTDHSGVHAMLDQAGIGTDRTIRFELASVTEAGAGDTAPWNGGQSPRQGSGEGRRDRWHAASGDGSGKNSGNEELSSRSAIGRAARVATRIAINFTA